MSKELNLGNIPVLQGQSNYREWSLEVRATTQLGGFWKAIVRMKEGGDHGYALLCAGA
jgi:hypothetical protein